MSFPELRGNFTPVPDVLFDTLLKAGLSREELIVTLFLVHKTYEFEKDITLIPLEAVVAGTDLDQAAALRGIDAALARNTLLEFHTESTANPRSFFLLNTEENRRVVGPILPEPPRGPPEALPLSGPPPGPPDEPAAPAPPAPPGRGLRRPVLERIVRLLGRAPTKDELGRLEELDPDESRLMKAMDQLETRGAEVYSSDLVIYEYESLKTSERKAATDTRRKAQLVDARDRQRTCKKCNGLGYVFLGVNTVEECVCRRTR